MATVKLLLKESIKNVGRVGDIVEVSPGYARNYLLPRDLAVQPTPNNVKKVEERRKEIERQERERREQQARMIQQLSGIEVHLERRANEQGHLFGSVTATDVAKGLQAQNFNVEPEDVNLPGKLDQVRDYTVTITGPGSGVTMTLPMCSRAANRRDTPMENPFAGTGSPRKRETSPS